MRLGAPRYSDPMVAIAPSILSADFARLGEQVAAVEQAGASLIHVDVMDGHFVPNISMGPVVVRSLRKVTALPLDCHLMIEEPDRYIPEFLDAGAAMISVHQEVCRHLHRTLGVIRQGGAKCGVVLNPATPVDALNEVIEMVDFVLVMSVNPGFSGQSFLPLAVGKIRQLHEWRVERRLDFQIEVDGGINLANAGNVVRAGADILVAASSIYGSPDPGEAVRTLRRGVEEAALLRA